MAQDSVVSCSTLVETSVNCTMDAGSSLMHDELKFVVVGQKLCKSVPLQNALKHFGGRVVHSDTGFEHMQDADNTTVFILDNFEGSIFQQLNRIKCRIVGPPVILKCASDNKDLPYKTRPAYCLSMESVTICCSGFRTRENLTMMVDHVHRMGGRFRKDFNAKITHLVANSTNGEKYRAAVSLGTPIMSEEWILRCWEYRDEIHVSAIDEHLMHHKLSPFCFSVLSFYGFSKEESRHMEDMTIENGGTVVESGAPMSTHLVVNDRTIRSIPFEVHQNLFLVKAELHKARRTELQHCAEAKPHSDPQWFWACIQMDACADESMYIYDDSESTTPGSQGGKKTPQTLSGSKQNRRKRLRENLAHLASEGEMDTPMFKRQSTDIARRSVSASFLDVTADTSVPLISESVVRSNVICSPTPVVATPKENIKLTKRQQTIMELFQTETNYVRILHTILKLFKEEIERPDQPGGPILDAQECKAIFGGIPPIYNVHVKIRDRLGEITNNWAEDMSIGAVFLTHADELTKLYPNFINYFEKTKEMIAQCDRTKPRFHAYLRLCQTKVECGRQTLPELLIRPVQRLGSITLLLRDILKRTDATHPEHQQLTTAIQTLELVMAHINEDKRKAEGHQAMFDIINDIENCPPNLLSAHRSFIQKVDAIEVNDELSGKGNVVTLFVFSDSIEICKRRTKVLNSKSPGIIGSKQSQKPYKHLCLIQFSCIKRVVDICDTADCRNMFALVTKRMDEDEKLYAFGISDQAGDKDVVLTFLSKAICTNMCRTDYETLLAAVESHDLNIDVGDLVTKKTLSRAASKFGKKVSRVFSLNKTPNGMKRAISSVTQLMSPLRRESSICGIPNLSSGKGEANSICAGFNSQISNEPDKYSEIVDRMSIGTPAMQRRRETLAGITYNAEFCNGFESSKTPQTIHENGDGAFTTPLPVKHRPNVSRQTPQSQSRLLLHRDFFSMQSLDFDCSSLMSRSPSSVSCSTKASENHA